MKRLLCLLLAIIMTMLAGCTANVAEDNELIDNETLQEPVNESKPVSPVLLTSVTYPESAAADDHERRYELMEENKVSEPFKLQVNDFALKTAASVIKDGENFNYSPASLYFAMAIAANGANGDTQKEILDLMNLSSKEDLSEVTTLYRLLYKDNEAFKLKIANSVWLDDSFTFKEDFIRAAQDEHYAQIYTADLPKKETGEAIGKWISEHTNGTLEPKVELPDRTIMTIVNTVYFNDKWSSPFDAQMTEKGTFHAASGDIPVDFMKKSGTGAGVVKNDEYQKVTLGFTGGSRIMFIMPTDSSSVGDLMKDTERLAAMIDEPGQSVGKLHLTLPKFTFKTDIDIKEALEQMGVTNMFSGMADFSNMSDDPARISQIKQGTYIALDEEGVEASAYTMMMAVATAMLSGEETLTFDRPFIYAIFSEGVIIFMGTVENPAL